MLRLVSDVCHPGNSTADSVTALQYVMTPNAKRPRRVGEPVQVYLSDRDRALLDNLAVRSGVPRSEVIRVALRQMANATPGAESGASLSVLIGAVDATHDIPKDAAERHDVYLYGDPPTRPRRKR